MTTTALTIKEKNDIFFQSITPEELTRKIYAGINRLVQRYGYTREQAKKIYKRGMIHVILEEKLITDLIK